MTDTCQRCSERPPVPGQEARRCGACLREILGRPSPYPSDRPIRADATIVAYESVDAGHRTRSVFEPAGEAVVLIEQRLSEGDDGRRWRTVGTERVTDLQITAPGE